MSLLLPAIAASALWYAGAKSYDVWRRANVPVENASQRSELKEPYRGAWGHISDYGVFTDNRGRFESVQEDVGVDGEQLFLVDYGNGQRVVQYHDPRILL